MSYDRRDGKKNHKTKSNWTGPVLNWTVSSLTTKTVSSLNHLLKTGSETQDNRTIAILKLENRKSLEKKNLRRKTMKTATLIVTSSSAGHRCCELKIHRVATASRVTSPSHRSTVVNRSSVARSISIMNGISAVKTKNELLAML
jgi:hypothetical protein